MPSKLETFLTQKKIDRRRVLATSHELERLRREDREMKLAIWQARKKDEKKQPGSPKPRSGRPLSASTLDKAFAGKAISGPAKTRVLRAVNRILEQRKQAAVALGDLFEAARKSEG